MSTLRINYNKKKIVQNGFDRNVNAKNEKGIYYNQV